MARWPDFVIIVLPKTMLTTCFSFCQSRRPVFEIWQRPHHAFPIVFLATDTVNEKRRPTSQHHHQTECCALLLLLLMMMTFVSIFHFQQQQQHVNVLHLFCRKNWVAWLICSWKKWFATATSYKPLSLCHSWRITWLSVEPFVLTSTVL